MTRLDDMGQKVKGKVQKAKGNIKMNTGDSLGGAVDKIKGSFNDTIGDMKLDAKNQADYRTTEDPYDY